MIRVLVADDDAMVRSGLGAILGAQPDVEVVGEATDGAEAVSLTRSTTPDVVVMDVRMPHVDGIAATRTVLGLDPAPCVLVVTTFENDSYVYDALLAGAQGFLLKRSGAEQLVQAVRTLAGGDAVLFPEAVRELVVAQRRTRELPELTQREQQVLRLLAQGCTNAEIGRELYLGTETVKTHVASLLRRLGVRDRTQAVVAAFESGFVRPGGD